MRKLIKKEILDLIRDPRIILPFIFAPIIFLVLGGIASQSVQSTVSEIVEPSLIKVNIIYEEKIPQDFINYLQNVSEKEKVIIYFTQKEKDISNILKETDYDVYILIPKGFFEKIERKETGEIYTFSKTTEFRLGSITGIKEIRVVRIIENYIKEKYINSTEILNFISRPLNYYSLVYLPSKNLLVSSQSLSSLFFGIFIASIIILSLGAIIMQISSTSTAIENEYKTLEILLLLPISRFKIFLAKLIGTFIVSMIGLSLFLIGFVFYLYLLFFSVTQPTQNLPFISIAIDPFSLALLIASFVISLLFMASLGVIIGALSNDVRLANTLIGPVFILLFFPAFYIIILTPSSPIKDILMSIPFLQTLIFSKEILLTNFKITHLIYLINSLLIILVLIYIIGRIFSLETLLNLQNKISRRFKKRI